MLFGHNTDVTVGAQTYHVQTEDRGTGHAIIDTTVYSGGRVVHRRTSSYGDLLPLDPRGEARLKARLDGQHQTVIKELRAGKLNMPASEHAPSSPKPASAAGSVAPQGKAITLELLNGKAWLSAGRATLKVAVHDKANGAAVAGARVIARIDGAETSSEFSTATGADGRAQLAFDMPPLSGTDPALVIEALYGKAHGVLRFRLRAKPKLPAAT